MGNFWKNLKGVGAMFALAAILVGTVYSYVFVIADNIFPVIGLILLTLCSYKGVASLIHPNK